MIQHCSCYVWILETSIRPSRSIHVVADARISFQNFSGWKLLLHGHTPSVYPFTVEGHLGAPTFWLLC